MQSHPTWVRGLKHNLRRYRSKRNTVAPYVGAWIETKAHLQALTSVLSHPTWVRGLKLSFLFLHLPNLMSHPTWVRGLKLTFCAEQCPDFESHPTWVRGLKPIANVNWQQAYPVAPYVGAWIETHC